MKKYRGLIILDADETLWSFKWHELTWATVLEPPLKIVSRDEIVDKNGVILFLRPGTREFLEKSAENNFLLSMASHNDWEPNVVTILELLDIKKYFYRPQVDWRPKDQQVDDILKILEKEKIEIPRDRVFFLDDRKINLDVVKQRFPRVNCLLITPNIRLYPEAWKWIMRREESLS